MNLQKFLIERKTVTLSYTTLLLSPVRVMFTASYRNLSSRIRNCALYIYIYTYTHMHAYKVEYVTSKVIFSSIYREIYLLSANPS